MPRRLEIGAAIPKRVRWKCSSADVCKAIALSEAQCWRVLSLSNSTIDRIPDVTARTADRQPPRTNAGGENDRHGRRKAQVISAIGRNHGRLATTLAIMIIWRINCLIPRIPASAKGGTKTPETLNDFNITMILMVPLAGIEPALLSEPDFESGASTNSAKGALRVEGRTTRNKGGRSTGFFTNLRFHAKVRHPGDIAVFAAFTAHGLCA